MTYRESVAANIVRADGEIRHLQVLDAVDVQSLIQDTMLDNAITLLGSHATCSKRVPGGLDMSLNPFLDMSNCSHVNI